MHNGLRQAFLAVSLLLITLGSHADGRESEPRQTERIPQGWATDYDYLEPIIQYLGRKYAESQNQGRSLYLYLYADRVSPCREFRARARRGQLDEFFEQRSVVMLDFEYINGQLPRTERFMNAPVLMSVNADGSPNSYMYPGFYLDGPRIRLKKALGEFFEENDRH